MGGGGGAGAGGGGGGGGGGGLAIKACLGKGVWPRASSPEDKNNSRVRQNAS